VQEHSRADKWVSTMDATLRSSWVVTDAAMEAMGMVAGATKGVPGCAVGCHVRVLKDGSVILSRSTAMGMVVLAAIGMATHHSRSRDWRVIITH